MSAVYNGRKCTILRIEKGQALITSNHNPRPSWVSLKFITYVGGQANGK